MICVFRHPFPIFAYFLLRALKFCFSRLSSKATWNRFCARRKIYFFLSIWLTNWPSNVYWIIYPLPVFVMSAVAGRIYWEETFRNFSECAIRRVRGGRAGQKELQPQQRPQLVTHEPWSWMALQSHFLHKTRFMVPHIDLSSPWMGLPLRSGWSLWWGSSLRQRAGPRRDSDVIHPIMIPASAAEGTSLILTGGSVWHTQHSLDGLCRTSSPILLLTLLWILFPTKTFPDRSVSWSPACHPICHSLLQNKPFKCVHLITPYVSWWLSDKESTHDVGGLG